MEIHIKVVPGMLLVLGVGGLAFSVWFIKGILASHGNMKIFGMLVAVQVLGLAGAIFYVGVRLATRKPKARMGAIWLSATMFFLVPFGVAVGGLVGIAIGGLASIVGVYCLWVLLDKETKQLLDEPAVS